MALRHGFKAWAERTAKAQRLALDKDECDRMPARELAAHLQVPVLTPHDFEELSEKSKRQLLQIDPGCWSGLAVRNGSASLIIQNPRHAETRQESDLFHELAHIICDHGEGRIELAFGVPMRSYESDQEEEAKHLGGALHIPRAALVKCIEEDMTAELIGAKYVASMQMVNYRRRITGVDTQFSRRKRRNS